MNYNNNFLLMRQNFFALRRQTVRKMRKKSIFRWASFFQGRLIIVSQWLFTFENWKKSERKFCTFNDSVNFFYFLILCCLWKKIVGFKCDGTPFVQSIGCNLHIRVEFLINLNDRRLIVGNFSIKTRIFIWIFNEIPKMG